VKIYHKKENSGAVKGWGGGKEMKRAVLDDVTWWEGVRGGAVAGAGGGGGRWDSGTHGP